MSAPASDLERAIFAFRRAHGVGYLHWLSGQPRDPREARARAWLNSERALEQLLAARDDGQLEPTQYAAVVAHVARARLEHAYEPARDGTSTLLDREVSVEGETRSLGQLLGIWAASAAPGPRERALAAMAPALEQFAGELSRARAAADQAVAPLFARLAPPRHDDAGPAGGSAEDAARWLEESEELTREALAFARHALGAAGQGGFDALWLALGQDFHGLFPRDGRLRRLAADWEPLGLRRLLAARARAALDHPGPFIAPQLVVLAVPGELRVSASAREYGLASELAAAEVVGRAAGYAHASEALPLALRTPTAGTVARGLGALAVQRFLVPRFLRRVRGLSGRESETVARVAAAYFLLDSRLAAASVLARRCDPANVLDESAALAERALAGSSPRGAAATLVLRLSPGAAFRGKVHGPELSWALRERYDEDWYLNPRAGEPLRGASARAGTFAIEAFAAELATSRARGIEKLSELF